MSTPSTRRLLALLALLAVLGMVATLLFATMGTASSVVPATPSNPAIFSACPDNADIPTGAFPDVPSGSFWDAGVSCIAYFEVTKGTPSGDYLPGADVTRAQMALFLARLAGPAGLALDATPPDAGFTDIGGLSAEAQLAINQLADAGIVKGKTATTYAPADTVWRQHMALFLTRFWDASTKGPGGAYMVPTTGAPFTDIGGTTLEAHAAINVSWNLGVATGTTATTFDPLGTVNRGQMSLFLSRVAAHTNARPTGVNIQANPMIVEDAYVPAVMPYDTVYSVTVRNTDFSPALNALVDAFRFDAENSADTPFNADGTCDLLKIEKITPGDVNKCTLTATDGAADANGNFAAETYQGVKITAGFWVNDPFVNLYAWTGATGSTFDADSTVYSPVTIEGLPIPPTPDHVAKALAVNGVPLEPCPCGIYVHPGDTVTWTAQLMTDGADGIPGNEDDVPVPMADVDVTFTDQWNDGSSSGTAISVVKTNASGAASYTKTEALAATDPNVTRTVQGTTVAYGGTGTTSAVWSNDAPQPKYIKVTTPTEYLLATVGANTVTATVLDQYGDPVPGVTIKFDSNVAHSSLQDIARVTDGSGSWTEPYTWTPATASMMETITVSETAVAPATPTASSGSVDFVWAIKALDGQGASAVLVVFEDVVANTLVAPITMPDYREFTWGRNANDHYFLNSVNSNQVVFEETIVKTGATFRVTSYSADGTTPANWMVYWTP